MVGNSKKLPCGHIFHTSCLRSWFQRQQTCPTCRLNILRNNNVNAPMQREEATALNNSPAGDSTSRFGSDESNQNANVLNVNGAMQIPSTPVVFPNPIPFLAHYSVPPPTMPPNLNSLTDEELRLLEGNERRSIEERLKLLGNIKLLIDASTVLMNQYNMITAYNVETSNTSAVVPPSSNISTKETTDSQIQSTSVENQSMSVTEPDSAYNQTSSKENVSDVTVEDIGREEDLNSYTNNVGAINSTELSELRKRRLKFLHETTQM